MVRAEVQGPWGGLRIRGLGTCRLGSGCAERGGGAAHSASRTPSRVCGHRIPVS